MYYFVVVTNGKKKIYTKNTIKATYSDVIANFLLLHIWNCTIINFGMGFYLILFKWLVIIWNVQS